MEYESRLAHPVIPNPKEAPHCTPTNCRKAWRRRRNLLSAAPRLSPSPGSSGTFPVREAPGLTFWFIADWVARRASAGGEFTTRNTLCRTPALAALTKLPWSRRERQPDGSAAEGHPHFSRKPHGLHGAQESAIRLHLMRDPVIRPISRPQRERAGLLVRRHFARSRIRCS
jgi:hypothetical protein